MAVRSSRGTSAAWGRRGSAGGGEGQGGRPFPQRFTQADIAGQLSKSKASDSAVAAEAPPGTVANQPFGNLVALQRSVKKIGTLGHLAKGRSTKQRTSSIQLGGGSLYLGPGLPRDVRHAGKSGPAERGDSPALSVHSLEGKREAPTAPVESRCEGGGDRHCVRRLVRLADAQARLAFLKEHPFFQGTSAALRERLAPQLVRRSSEQTKEVVEQGEEPAGNMDYLFLTAPDLNTKVEILFDGRPIAVLSGSAIFGQEVVFGVSRTFIFGVRAATATSTLWVIPRAVVQSLLQRASRKSDAQLLRERAHVTTTSILRNWLAQPTAQIRVRLFENAEHAFKSALVQAMVLEIHAPGATVRKVNDSQDSCLCVFRGEASAYIPGACDSVAKLSHGAGTSAWAAWWGLLEALNVCARSPTEVKADTDCIVMCLLPESLKALRKQFPMECGLFDKVAKEHVKLLQPHAMDIATVPAFQGCDPEELSALRAIVDCQIVPAGMAVVTEGAAGEDMFFIARGTASVRTAADRNSSNLPAPSQKDDRRKSGSDGTYMRRLSGRSGRNTSAERVVSMLYEGSFFSEAVALGFGTEQRATVFSDSICDIRVLPGPKLEELLALHPSLVPRFLRLAEESGCTLECAGKEAEDLLPLRGSFSSECLRRLEAEMTRLFTTKAQRIARQGHECKFFYVLVEGAVTLEVDGTSVSEVEAPALLCERALTRPGAKCAATIRSKGVCCLRLLKADRAAHLLERFPGDRERISRLAEQNLESLRATLVDRNHGKGHLSHQNMLLPTGSPCASRSATPRVDQDRPGSTFSSVSSCAAEGEDSDDRPNRVFLEKFFKTSDPSFLEFIAHGMEKVVYSADEVMLQQGDEGDFALLIQRGSGIVEVGGVRVGEVKAGSLIGEPVLLGKCSHRTATVRAVGLVSAFTLTRLVLLEAFEEFPAEKLHLDELMHLREQTNMVLTARRDSGEVPVAQRRCSRVADANTTVFRSVSRRSKGAQPTAEPAPGTRTARGGDEAAIMPPDTRRSGSRVLGTNATPRPTSRNRVSSVSVGAAAVKARSASCTAQRTTAWNGSELVEQEENDEDGTDDEASSNSGRHNEEARRKTVLGLGRKSFAAPVANGKARGFRRLKTLGNLLQPRGSDPENARGSRTPQATPGADEEQGGEGAGSGSDSPGSARGSHGEGAAEEEDGPEVCPTISLRFAKPRGTSAASDRPSQQSECAQWARRRRELVRAAQLKRDQRLAHAGELLPLVPQEQGYQVPEPAIGVSSPFAAKAKCGGTTAPPWRQRLLRAEALYAPPVWHEVFGY